MVCYAVKFNDGTYKTQFKKNNEYGRTKHINHAKLYASERYAKENTNQISENDYEIVKVLIGEENEVKQIDNSAWVYNDISKDFYCSNCKDAVSVSKGSPIDFGLFYCPHCGRRMDEEIKIGRKLKCLA